MFRKSSLDIKERNKKTFFYLFPKRQNFPAYRVAIAANQDTSWAGKKQPLTWCSKEHTFRVSNKIIAIIPPLKIKIKHLCSLWTIHLEHPQRSIFQTFWKKHSCAKFLSFELETSNFGSSYIFLSPSKWGGQFLPNLMFWTPKRHISGKCRYHYSKICVSWDKCMKFWLLHFTWNMPFLGSKCQVR